MPARKQRMICDRHRQPSRLEQLVKLRPPDEWCRKVVFSQSPMLDKQFEPEKKRAQTSSNELKKLFERLNVPFNANKISTGHPYGKN